MLSVVLSAAPPFARSLFRTCEAVRQNSAKIANALLSARRRSFFFVRKKNAKPSRRAFRRCLIFCASGVKNTFGLSLSFLTRRGFLTFLTRGCLKRTRGLAFLSLRFVSVRSAPKSKKAKSFPEKNKLA